MLVDGKWTTDWHPVQAKDEKGGFVRQISSFRNWVTPDGAPGPTGTGGFEAEAGRYHLYVALICPWASRTLIGRALKGLDEAIPVSIVEPALGEQGWRFGDYPGSTRDMVNGATYMHEIYTRADPAYSGRATVPVLWDKRRRTIVNNESADILRMMNDGFGALASGEIDLYPVDLRARIDALNAEYVALLKAGKDTEAQAVFKRIVAEGLATRNLPVRLLFAPASSEFYPDPVLIRRYGSWLGEVADQLSRSTQCLEIVGHASRTGSEAANRRLSNQRALAVRRILLKHAPALGPRLSTVALGRSQTEPGAAPDEMREAGDRRVDLKVVDCP